MNHPSGLKIVRNFGWRRG